MPQSISRHSLAYFSTHNLAENEAVPEMSKVTYYHSNIRLSFTEFFCSFTLFSLTTSVLILLIKPPLLKFKSKKPLLFWHIKIAPFHSRWKCFNRVDIYLWRGTKSGPHIFLNFWHQVLYLIQINHQPDATIFQFIILTFVYSLTCFGRFPPIIRSSMAAVAASGFNFVSLW